MNKRLIHLTDETELHIGYTEFMEALENCKIHSIQQDDKFNTILVIEPEYVPEENWEE